MSNYHDEKDTMSPENRVAYQCRLLQRHLVLYSIAFPFYIDS